MDFLARLFDTTDFNARWKCGSWTPGHGYLHILSDLGVWSAYVAIPCVLAYFVLRRKDVPFRSIFWLFVLFILACGTTHLMEVILFWWPAYRLAGVIKLLTALVSWCTVVALVPVTPRALALRSPEELEREILARQEAESCLERVNHELKQQIEALRASEERFRLLVDGTRDYAIYLLDSSGHIVSWNPGAERITQCRAEEAIGQHFSRFYSPEDVHAGKPEQELRVAEAEGRFEEEGWRLRKDGSRYWSSVVVTALRDARGRLRGFSKITRDMTERRQAEENLCRLREEEAARRSAEANAAVLWEERERLRQAEQEIRGLNRDLHRRVTEFQTLLDVAPVGIAVADDPECKHIWCNAVMTRLLGLSPQANISLSAPAGERPGFKVFEEGRELAASELPMQVAITTGQAVGNVRHDLLLPEGTWVNLLQHAVPLHDEQGRVRGGLYVGVDVSEQERMLKALREAERRWRTLTEMLPNLIWTDLPDGQCDWLSSQWGKYTGIPEKELLGLRWLELLHPDDRQRTLDYWQRACADQGDYDLEYRIRRHDGQYRWFKTRGVPIRDEQGRIVYWFGTCTDIHDRRLAEQQLREDDQRRNTFLATLAHELRNPLAPLRNGLQVLRMSPNGEAAAQAREMMERQVEHLIRLIEDLLDVSRILRGKITLRKERAALASVLDRAVETAQPLIDAQGHQLTIDRPPDALTLEADPVRLAQVVGNLLTNAAKYTERNGRIWLSARCEGDQAVLRVRDNGIGLAPGLLPRVFDLFVQADHSTTKAQGGLGIGLTLVKSLVELHGGTVEAHSDGLGNGSEFVVRLPLAAPGRETSGDIPGAAALPPGTAVSHRLLVIDDNKDAANSLALLLLLQGHEVRVAHDGPTGLEMIPDFRPELVFLDLGMPGMDGFEVARRLRRLEGRESLRLVALTGWGQQEDRRRTAEAGFDHHLVKPIEPGALERLLAELGKKSSPNP